MLVSFGYVGIRGYSRFLKENKILHQVIERLQADSRIAEVLVTKVEYDEPSKKNLTTIKFLEYDVEGNPLTPRYFTFAGNIIQFQSLVIRFDDIHIRNAAAGIYSTPNIEAVIVADIMNVLFMIPF